MSQSQRAQKMRKRSVVFLRMLKSNMLIVTAIVLCLLVLSVQVRVMMERTEEEGCRSMLDSGMKQMSLQLKNVRTSLISFRELIAEKNPGGLKRSDAVNLNSARSTLGQIVANNPLIGELVYVCPNEDLVVTTMSVFYGLESFQESYSFEGLDESVFYDYKGTERLAITRFLPCTSISSRYNLDFDVAFCYAVPLDMEYYSLSQGVVFAFLRMDSLIDLAVEEAVQPCARFTLYDNRRSHSGTLLLDWGEADEGACFETELVNEGGTLRACVSVSSSYVSGRMEGFNRFVLLMMLFSIVTGAALAFWAAHRQSLPVRRVIASLQSRNLLISSNRDEYDSFLSSVDTLIGEKELVKRQLNEYQASLWRNILDRLFSNGLIRPDDEGLLRMRMEGFPGRFAVYCGRLFVGSADTNDSMQLTLVMLLDFLKSRLPEQAILHSTDTAEFGLIYPCTGDVQEAERELSRTLESAGRRFSAQVLLVRGGVCESISQIGACFERARMSSAQERESGGHIVAAEMSQGESIWRFKRLMNLYQLLVSGDESRALEEIHMLMGAPADDLPLELRERYALLRACILMAAAEGGNEGDAPGVPSFSGASAQGGPLAALETAAHELCETTRMRQAGAQDERAQAFVEYIEENYADPELCASSMASDFHVSEKYLFSLFKKKTGNSPTSYLHHVRMLRAAELLRTTDDTVQAISVQVGFVNFGTFYKAFKREYGVAPGKYRGE